MKKVAEKLLSWSPVILLLLVGLFVWTFLLTYKGEDGGQSLLQEACVNEEASSLQRGAFTIIYRTRGCGRTSALTGENTSADLLWWEKSSERFRFPPLRPGTTVDVRPGQPLIRYSLGRPGAIQIPPADLYTRRYLLAKGINSLALHEAFPQIPTKTIEIVAGSLALQMLGRDSARVIQPDREAQLQAAQNWPEVLENCPGRCSPKDLFR